LNLVHTAKYSGKNTYERERVYQIDRRIVVAFLVGYCYMETMKLIVASDIHYDPNGHLTAPDEVKEMIQKISLERPDAVILAGDISHGAASFEACLALFKGCRVPVGVLAGNHDIWMDKEAGFSSEELWSYQLESLTIKQGAIWLEKQNMRFGKVGIVGSMAWYDYSAIDPAQKKSHQPDVLETLKACFNNDAHWIDWQRKDRDVAAELREKTLKRLREMAAQPEIEKIVVVTHVPILEEQMERNPEDAQWGLTNAYFGHLTMGDEVVKEPKVTAIVSGHTHIGKSATRERTGMKPIDVRVVDTDYGVPGFTVLSL
jgi:predicted phosphodiesterase